ncbi:MAG: glucose-1-phosphate adenylyltransferase [Thermodesulfobacteriota bacterium]
MSKTLTMILAGGEGKRLHSLCKERAKPAVPFGSRYRIIDFVLSNFVNSGFYKIKVLTQFKSESLNHHLSLAWRLTPRLGHYIEPVPPQMKIGRDWYRGTIDAIYQNLDLIRYENPDYVFVFGGDHIYKMDVRQMMTYHIGKKADLTIAAVPVPLKEGRSYGVIEVDKTWKVIGFEEKPKNPKSIPGKPGMALASMGNYIFNADVLVREAVRDSHEDTAHDFGKSVLPQMYKTYKVYAYDFHKNSVPGMAKQERGYWRDVGDIDSYWQANMDLISVSPVFNLYNEDWPIRSYYPPLPPAKFVFADEKKQRIGIATDSMVAEGCVISGGHVNRSILSPKVRINSFSRVTESILMEGVNIGRYVRVKRAIIDKFVNIPPHTEIGYDPEKDRKKFYVSPSGIVVIPKKSTTSIQELLEMEKKGLL